MSVREVRKWQSEHGLLSTEHWPEIDRGRQEGIEGDEADGQGEGDSEGRVGGADKINFADNAAGNPEGPEGAADGGGLADSIVEGGEVGGEEKREEGTEDPSKEGGGLVQEGADKLGNDIAGEGDNVAVGAAARLALVPHIVNLLRAHKFEEAVKYVVDSVGYEDRFEIIKAVAEKVGGELGEHALTIFEHAIVAGLVVDVLKVGWEWTYGGIKAVQEAHEKGDRDSRIGIYASAWADCVIDGSHDNPGAVTAEQREAMQFGMQDGLATREQSLLLAEYHNQRNAKRALRLEDALYKRAGITGIKRMKESDDDVRSGWKPSGAAMALLIIRVLALAGLTCWLAKITRCRRRGTSRIPVGS